MNKISLKFEYTTNLNAMVNYVPSHMTELGETFYVNIEYDMGQNDSVQIWARPRTNGSSTSGYRAHGSSVYNKYEGTTDIIQGHFFFDEPTIVDEVIVRMKNTETDNYVCVAKMDVQLEWR